jgi:hypothetical protein
MKTTQDLFDAVVEQIKTDLAAGDETAIIELLSKVPRAYLVGYLPEEQHEEFAE